MTWFKKKKISLLSITFSQTLWITSPTSCLDSERYRIISQVQTFSSLSGRWGLAGSSSPLDLCQPWQYFWFSSWEGLELHIFALDRPQTTRLLLTCFLMRRFHFYPVYSPFCIFVDVFFFFFLSFLSIKSILVSPFNLCAPALIFNLVWVGGCLLVGIAGHYFTFDTCPLTWFIVSKLRLLTSFKLQGPLEEVWRYLFCGCHYATL